MNEQKINVLIVDDSAVIRAIIRRTLEQDSRIFIVGTAVNGQEAVDMITQTKPDIVILDIEMPVMDGMTALPLILKSKPDTLVLICSTLSARGADISVRALAMGAADCLLKPGGDSITTAYDFQSILLRTVLGLVRNTGTSQPIQLASPSRISAELPPRILAIGSSTGGPKALTDLLKDLKSFPIPIVITQHMPKSFTALLAQNLQQNCGIPCFEGAENMPLTPGSVYIAPGGMHMKFRQNKGEVRIVLDDGPAENFCKPSVNPMLRSLCDIYGNRILALMLTGMGSDGLEGCRQVTAQGGRVIAQDQASSVVWGMPGAVAQAGLCTAILPLPKIAAWLRNIAAGQKVAS